MTNIYYKYLNDMCELFAEDIFDGNDFPEMEYNLRLPKKSSERLF